MIAENSKPKTISEDELSREKQRLLDWIRQVYDGRIENLIIRDGEPQFVPLPRMVVTRDIQSVFDCHGPHVNHLRHMQEPQIQTLFEFLDAGSDIVIGQLEIQRALPVRITFSDIL